MTLDRINPGALVDASPARRNDARMSTLFAQETGSGPPVLLLHSSGFSSSQWRRLTNRLAGTHRVIAPDLPGYGRNEPLPDDRLATYGFLDDVAAVEELASTLGGPVHVIGHSYGGLLAFQLALRGRVPVASITAYEPVCFGVLHSLRDAEGLANLPDESLFFELGPGGLEGWLERFVDWWQGPGAWAALPPSARAPFVASGLKTFTEVRSLVADRTSHEAYRALTKPALLLTGTRSPLAARRTCALLAALLPRGRLVTLEGAGHMGPLTHADAVNSAVAAFLAEAG